MSVRPIKKVLQTKATLEGAGVKLQRAFGFGDTSEFDPFLLFDDFRNDNPADYRAGFPGILIAALKPSRMCWRGPSNTATALATAAISVQATCSG
jgi:hypothetical protein